MEELEFDFTREKWTEANKAAYHRRLTSYGNPARSEWTKRIINTELPCLAIPSAAIKNIAKEIGKGDYMSFIDLWQWDYYDDAALIGILTAKIKPFAVYADYLRRYSEKADNWALCDILTFNVNEKNAEEYFNLALSFIQDEHTFVRRVGVDVFFKFIENGYLERVFGALATLVGEQEYYVNMAVAWLIAECFTKKREETLAFFEKDLLNTFTVNKAVQKCRDSYRVSAEDKEMLLRFKKK